MSTKLCKKPDLINFLQQVRHVAKAIMDIRKSNLKDDATTIETTLAADTPEEAAPKDHEVLPVKHIHLVETTVETTVEATMEANGDRLPRDKICYVCKTKGSWSTRHEPELRRQAWDRYKQESDHPKRYDRRHWNAFLVDYKGLEGIPDEDDTNEVEQMMMHASIDEETEEQPEEKEDDESEYEDIFFTELGEIIGPEATAILNDQVVLHAITKSDTFCPNRI